MNRRETALKLTLRIYRLTLLFPKKDPLRRKTRKLAIDLMADLVRFDRMSRPGVDDSSDRLKLRLENEFDLMSDFLKVAREQKWAKIEEVDRLMGEYGALRSAIGAVPIEREKPPVFQKQERPVAAPPRIIHLGAAADSGNNLLAPAPDGNARRFDNTNQEIQSRGYQNQASPLPRVSLPPVGLQLVDGLDRRQKKVLKTLQEKKVIQIGELSKIIPEVSRRTLLRDLEKLIEFGFAAQEGGGRGAYYRFQMKRTAEVNRT